MDDYEIQLMASPTHLGSRISSSTMRAIDQLAEAYIQLSTTQNEDDSVPGNIYIHVILLAPTYSLQRRTLDLRNSFVNSIIQPGLFVCKFGKAFSHLAYWWHTLFG